MVHGEHLLNLLPPNARLPMMKVARVYQQEMDEDPPFDVDEDEDDGELDAAAADDDEDDEDDNDEDDDDDIMLPEHFYFFVSAFAILRAPVLHPKAKPIADKGASLLIGCMSQSRCSQKKFFTEAEAAEFVAGAKEGGALSNAVEAALDSLFAAEEEDEEQDDGEDDGDEDEDEDEDWTDPATIAWKQA